MRAFIINVILCILTHVWIQEVLSSVSRIRQKRTWIVEYLTMKRGNIEPLRPRDMNLTMITEFKVSGEGIDKEPKNVFWINPITGYIDVLRQTGYDDIKKFTLKFESTTPDKEWQKLGVVINIEEIYEPFFTESMIGIKANENTLQGTNLLRLDSNSTKYENIVYRIISVTPTPSSSKFLINENNAFHFISFWGCLDYEENKEYTIKLGAEGIKKDKRLRVSSDATVKVTLIDNNDHKPEVLEISGNGRLKESEIGVVVYTVHVSDKDSQGSAAWRAKFQLHGEGREYFKIETDSVTNDGVMTVVKPLDYEAIQRLNLKVELESEEPFFSCSVRKINNEKLWDVDYLTDGSSSTMISIPITITVEDVNEPPEFMDTVKHITILENMPAGHSLWTFTAKDQDQHSLRIIKGKDVDNWVTVDEKSGLVSTAKVLDRESPFISDSTYTVILYAVDNGTPPMTGTATLIIHLTDLNDNVPILEVDRLHMCSSSSKHNITAVDLDLPPLGAPFIYELLGDVSEDWRIEPTHGITVDLVKDSSVHSGIHQLSLKITDSEGRFSIQNLSVTVCDCSFRETCRPERRYSAGSSVGVISTILISIVLMLCLLLMAFKVSCKAEKQPLPDIMYSEATLLHSNYEAPGTDVDSLILTQVQNMAQYKEKKQCRISEDKNCITNEKMQYQDEQAFSHFPDGIFNRKTLHKDEERYRQDLYWMHHAKADIDLELKTTVDIVLSMKLQKLHQEECSHDELITYASEGECDSRTELDSISIPETGFSLTDLTDLDSRFKPLAAKCRPDLIL